MTVAPRRERNALETQQRILAAAELEFASKGFDGARLGNIARAAGVQQALIHHYFADKVGLYRGVVESAVGAISMEGGSLLSHHARAVASVDLRAVVEAFVDLLMAFAREHAPVLAILRHATASDPHAHGERAEAPVDAIVRDAVREKARPVFEAVVDLLTRLARAGRIAPDVDVRHFAISALVMAWGPVVDEGIVRSLWPVDTNAPRFVAARRAEIVRTLLARLESSPVRARRTKSARAPAANDAVELRSSRTKVRPRA